MRQLLSSERSSNSISNKLVELENFIASYSKVLVAYSGGVDSSLVAFVSSKVLNKGNAKIILANSPSLNSRELKYARELANKNDWNYSEIETNEFDNQDYRKNNPSRCFFCKFELYSSLDKISKECGIEVVFNGTNLDDLGDYRPGNKAASQIKVVSPLLECNISKSEVRDISLSLGLENWSKPAQPCLASRVPYGTEITMNILKQIEDAENYLHDLGFRNFRVRNHGSVARIELDESDFKTILNKKLRFGIDEKFKKLGFKFVSLDLKSFESGSLNSEI
ncbi:MAG: ATP-dependent sacrificial sulfur transferase LarE [Chloroflexota bacterium]|nr:ATP-dependent sacrificial sulfur transferase LarE [Chloroflexota bacterium]MQG04799.1 ATP-dependent sacrificial sulfur transferase LarE [SAR202 cluster bacterium]|tara:strand:- start:1505 stop:2344 length:840 start_codon:yes stop_codon:yes gene_type:complete